MALLFHNMDLNRISAERRNIAFSSKNWNVYADEVAEKERTSLRETNTGGGMRKSCNDGIRSEGDRDVVMNEI